MTTNESPVQPIDILLVEDNPGDVRLTQEALRECKFYNNLHVVHDGVEALAFLRQQDSYRDAPKPDLILLDINLPRKSGLEVLQEVKNDDAHKSIPVVILTTSQAEQDVFKAYDLHANCYIVKPMDLNQFVEVVKSVENFWISIVKLPAK